MSVRSAASPWSIGRSTSESPRSTNEPTRLQSFVSDRPAMAMRRLDGACLARWRVTRVPVNPVAPHTTTSNALDASGSFINDARGVGDVARDARRTNASRSASDDVVASARVVSTLRARARCAKRAVRRRLTPNRCGEIPAAGSASDTVDAAMVTRALTPDAVDIGVFRGHLGNESDVEESQSGPTDTTQPLYPPHHNQRWEAAVHVFSMSTMSTSSITSPRSRRPSRSSPGTCPGRT